MSDLDRLQRSVEKIIGHLDLVLSDLKDLNEEITKIANLELIQTDPIRHNLPHLSEYDVSVKNNDQRIKRTRRNFRVSLKDLSDVGYLLVEETFRCKFREIPATAILLPNGQIRSDGLVFDAVSGSVSHWREKYSGSFGNIGWSFWTVERNGNTLTLKQIRDQYLKDREASSEKGIDSDQASGNQDKVDQEYRGHNFGEISHQHAAPEQEWKRRYQHEQYHRPEENTRDTHQEDTHRETGKYEYYS